MLVEIRPASVKELVSNPSLVALLSRYATESAIAGLPAPKADLALYARLEALGSFKIVAAFSGDIVVGLICVLVSPLPHYSENVATIESFFVLGEYRKGGVGTKLLAKAKQLAKVCGAVGLLISAPVNSRLAYILENSGSCVETNRVFFTKL